jgi:hypothetical protein
MYSAAGADSADLNKAEVRYVEVLNIEIFRKEEACSSVTKSKATDNQLQF